MKWFYLIAAAAAAVALAAVPFALLPRTDLSRYEGKVVSYDSYATKVKSLDPATCGDTVSANLQANFYEGLYGYQFLKRPAEIVPVLAEAMPRITDEGNTVTIRIRKGIRYCRNECFGRGAGGRPGTRTVRAEDFVLAFKRIADYHIDTELALALIEEKVAGITEYRRKTQAYDKGDFSRYDLPLEGVKALDEHTLQVRLTMPFPQLVYVLAMTTHAPVPREMIDYHLATRDDGRGGREPIPLNERSPEIHDYRSAVGTGPYYLTHFVDGGDIVLERNPDVRAETYPTEGEPADANGGLLADAGRRVPFIDVRSMQFVPETNPAWMLFMTGQSDTAAVPMKMYQQVITPSKELTDSLTRRGIRLMKYRSPAVYWLAFHNQDRVLGASRSLRQALCLTYNVEQEIEVLYNGRGVRALTTVPDMPGSFDGVREAGPSPYARLDLAAARAKLADARRELEAAGVLKPGEPFPTLTLDLGGQEEDSRRMGEFAQGQFRRIGIDLKVELNDWPTLQKKVHNKQCQIYAMGWHADYPDTESFLQLYYTPNIERGTNHCNYSNPEFDALFRQAAVLSPSPRRTQLYAKMIRLLNEDCPVLLLSEPISFVLVQPWVHNLKPHPFGYGYGRYTRIDVQARERAGGGR